MKRPIEWGRHSHTDNDTPPSHSRTTLSSTTKTAMPSPQLDKLPFTIHNLPYGVIKTSDSSPRCAVAIGDHAVDLAKYASTGAFKSIGNDLESIFTEVSWRDSRHTADKRSQH